MNKEVLVKKILTVLLIMLTLSLFVGVNKNYAFGELNVKTSDNCIDHSPQLEISFTTSFTLKKGDEIKIKLDGARINEKSELTDSVTVNGKHPLTAVIIGVDSIRISVPSDVNQGEQLIIIINKGVFINPGTAGFYKLILYINGQEYSYYYHVVDSNNIVKNITLKILDNGFEIRFNVGEQGNLKPYTIKIGQVTIQGVTYYYEQQVPPGDYVYIRLSSVISKAVPSTVTFREVSINGTLTLSNPTVTTHFEGTAKEEKEFSIAVPKEIKNNGEVVVVFKGIYENFQIPKDLSGNAFVRVWTSKETTSVESNHIEIKSQNLINTLINVTPEIPDGKKEFYITKPTVELSVDKGSAIEKIETFISIDGKDFQAYTGPTTFDDGIHTLSYYSTGYSGKNLIKEDIKEFTLKVDTTSPVINIISPLVTDNRIYTLKLEVSDDNIKEVSVKLGSITYYPYKNNIEIPTILFDKETTVEIRAVDFAGHVSEYNNVIKLN
jgi:hypothetical protein